MLRDMSGIHSIRVALLAERGVVEYDPKVWDPEKIVNVSEYLSPPSSLTHHVLYHRKYLISVLMLPKYLSPALIPSTSVFTE